MKYIDVHTHKESSLKEREGLSILNSEKYRYDSFISMGIHPWHISKESLEEKLDNIEKFIERVNCLAIGEAGIDKLCKTDFLIQKECFKKLITIADVHRKPLIIHCVRAYDEVISMLKGFCQPVIFHGFQKGTELALSLTNRNYYLSFGKALLENNSKAKESFRYTNPENIFLETDASEIGIESIYDEAASIKAVDKRVLSETIFNNFKKVFNVSI